MNVLAVISPGLKVLFERVGRPEIINRPGFLRLGGSGAVIACNHVGWADSLWMAYALYPRQLRYMSKQELFNPLLSRWVLEYGGSIPIDRAEPSISSIKAAVNILKYDGVMLIFPTGTRSDENIAFKRGAASTCARLFSRPEADASRAFPAPASNPGDIWIADPNSGVTPWERDDNCAHATAPSSNRRIAIDRGLCAVRRLDFQHIYGPRFAVGTKRQFAPERLTVAFGTMRTSTYVGLDHLGRE